MGVRLPSFHITTLRGMSVLAENSRVDRIAAECYLLPHTME
jgi:hypothetical protein